MNGDRAAYLITGFLRKDLTDEEREELDDWISASDVNMHLFERATDESLLDAFPSLRVLCRRSGLNADKLKKGFKYLFGQGPYGYHLHLRMEEAKRLLSETDEPVCAIAWTLGYEHASNFCIRFKKIVGCMPGAFRLKHSITV